MAKVDVIQVKVINLQIGKLFLNDRRDMLRIVRSKPKLRHNEEVLSLHRSFLDGMSSSSANLLFVSID
jgi:hypothetical protein